MSDSGTERMIDVQRAEAVVASFSDECPHAPGEGVGPLTVAECDGCMVRLIAKAITERRVETRGAGR